MILRTSYDVSIKMFSDVAQIEYVKKCDEIFEVRETLIDYRNIAQKLIEAGAITEYSVVANLNVKKEV